MTKTEKQNELDRLRIVSAELEGHVKERREELVTWLVRLSRETLNLSFVVQQEEGRCHLRMTELDEVYRMVQQKYQGVRAVERSRDDVTRKIAAAVIDLADDELWKEGSE